MDTSATKLLCLRPREHCRGGGKKIVRAGDQEVCSENASSRFDRKTIPTIATIRLPQQDQNNYNINRHAKKERGNLMGSTPTQRTIGTNDS